MKIKNSLFGRVIFLIFCGSAVSHKYFQYSKSHNKVVWSAHHILLTAFFFFSTPDSKRVAQRGLSDYWANLPSLKKMGQIGKDFNDGHNKMLIGYKGEKSVKRCPFHDLCTKLTGEVPQMFKTFKSHLLGTNRLQWSMINLKRIHPSLLYSRDIQLQWCVRNESEMKWWSFSEGSSLLRWELSRLHASLVRLILDLLLGHILSVSPLWAVHRITDYLYPFILHLILLHQNRLIRTSNRLEIISSFLSLV